MDFGDAIKLLKQGNKVKRHNWGGYWFMPRNGTRVYTEISDGFMQTNDMIVAQLKDGGGLAPATPYMADMLANDWELVSLFYDGFGTPLAVGDYVIYAPDCIYNLHKGKISQLDYSDGMYKVTLESGRFFTCTEGTFGYLAVVKAKEE
ncbi:hypothetical protein LpeD_146 [Lactobacillus phage LpeD]|uniref:Thoeris anti-defense 2-like domain-containing protein n=1 Tax=Lactobacillus phage LpeD TaxID=2041210 RepID=A0A291I9L9_9CAUD|nr:hypothetical protein HWB32_gp080 [Lactobacillus phage LpeD]ATG86391.1 hypothetical protein LpeD_146 [Lactobacillus phage LpeD]